MFRTMLLTTCQKEFDTDYIQDINYDKLIQEVESCEDEQKKKELEEIADDKLCNAKLRWLGNIRFIGELFKLSMLTEGIMIDCIERLLKQENDEETIESLCRFLTTIGKEVDKPNNAFYMQKCFDKLAEILKKKDTVSARIRSRIQNVVDLRINNWVPSQNNAPRKIQEILEEHSYFKIEHEEDAVRLAGFSWNKQKTVAQDPAQSSMTPSGLVNNHASAEVSIKQSKKEKKIYKRVMRLEDSSDSDMDCEPINENEDGENREKRRAGDDDKAENNPAKKVKLVSMKKS
jgi:hypothetical protein